MNNSLEDKRRFCEEQLKRTDLSPEVRAFWQRSLDNHPRQEGEQGGRNPFLALISSMFSKN